MENTTSSVTKARRKLADQDQRLANDITAALTLMETARDGSELQEIISGLGYEPAALDEAITNLQEPAQAAFEARAAAMSKADTAQDRLAASLAEEQGDYTDYRETARAIFTDKADKAALGLNGSMPRDLQKFLTEAKSAYSAGKKAPYTESLTRRGYSPARLDAELAGLKLLGDLSAGSKRAAGAAQKATADRDKAAKSLKAWVSEFRRIAKRALRGRPDLLAALGL